MKPQAFAKVVIRPAMLFLLSAGLLVAQNKDSAAISKLLTQVKTHAALANDDASTLDSFTRSGVDWSTHGSQLNLMREHVNNLITDANEMIALRHEGSPWQQQAIDRIQPLLPVIADHLSNTINHLNENRSLVHLKPYRDYVHANQELIGNAYQVVKSYASYAQAIAKADALEKQLELPSASTESAEVEQ